MLLILEEVCYALTEETLPMSGVSIRKNDNSKGIKAVVGLLPLTLTLQFIQANIVLHLEVFNRPLDSKMLLSIRIQRACHFIEENVSGTQT